jgi:acetyl-CoA C-acetyltransferase
MAMSAKTRKLARQVCIVGVGTTPIGSYLETPGIKDLTPLEMFAAAAHDAMRDAGVTPKDVDALFAGTSMNVVLGHEVSPQVSMADWVGLRGKPAVVSEALCSTSFYTMQQGIMAVASGAYEMVMVGGQDLLDRYTDGKAPNHKMRPISEFVAGGGDILTPGIDPQYARWNGGAGKTLYDEMGADYRRLTGLSWDQIDDIQTAVAINDRHNAEKNPKAYNRTPFEEIAAQAGFDSVKAYMKSKFNPILTNHHRLLQLSGGGEQGGAIILCSAERAKDLKQIPIEVLGFGIATRRIDQPRIPTINTQESIDQAYEMAGVTPDEIDYLQLTDMLAGEHVPVAEMVGYLPKGEGYKYVLDGRTTYEGDKPINTNGGDLSAGHDPAVSGLEEFNEAVLQMRGQAGERQMKKVPRTAFVRGEGGAHTCSATILRTLD